MYIKAHENGLSLHLPPGETFKVSIDLDTEGGTDLFALGVGFLFDDYGGVDYDQGSSSTNTYLLYTTAKNPYLTPASTCGGVSGSGCNTYLTNPSQVQLEFLSSAVAWSAGVPAASDGFENLATLIFHTDVMVYGYAGLMLTADPARGGVLALADGTLIVPEFEYAVVPEPQTALLVGLGCALLAQVRRNRIRTAAAPAVNGESPAPRA